MPLRRGAPLAAPLPLLVPVLLLALGLVDLVLFALLGCAIGTCTSIVVGPCTSVVVEKLRTSVVIKLSGHTSVTIIMEGIAHLLLEEPYISP